ncbi:MAG TPA: hypothetical protein VME63_02365 [Dyella sp.]|uniref:hypothetical protein n=1 Tax=Dyella sp. TaxID=1869338 RepID=UPI002C16E5B1|nr:hypothetical protein [Dyella sp.]HTV84218.1 hypothetical protein [Dyella sp.]
MPRFLVATPIALALGLATTLAVAGTAPSAPSPSIAQDLRAAANDMVDVAAASDARRLQADIGADPRSATAPLLFDFLGDIGDTWNQRNHNGDLSYSANANPSSHQVDAVKLLVADGANACAVQGSRPRNWSQVPADERAAIEDVLRDAAPRGCSNGRPA